MIGPVSVPAPVSVDVPVPVVVSVPVPVPVVVPDAVNAPETSNVPDPHEIYTDIRAITIINSVIAFFIILSLQNEGKSEKIDGLAAFIILIIRILHLPSIM